MVTVWIDVSGPFTVVVKVPAAEPLFREQVPKIILPVVPAEILCVCVTEVCEESDPEAVVNDSKLLLDFAFVKLSAIMVIELPLFE